jgi:hypothetical protein
LESIYLDTLHTSHSLVRWEKSSLQWAGHVAWMEVRNTYRILMEKPLRKHPLGSHKMGANHWTLWWVHPVHILTSYFLIAILIISPHLCLCIPSGLFVRFSNENVCIHLFFSPWMLSQLYRFNSSNNTRCRIQTLCHIIFF